MSTCIHQHFTWNDDDEMICAECGALVYDDGCMTILTKNKDGSYEAFHRSFDEQLKLSYKHTKIH